MSTFKQMNFKHRINFIWSHRFENGDLIFFSEIFVSWRERLYFAILVATLWDMYTALANKKLRHCINVI